MSLYNGTFWFVSFFLIGVLGASVGQGADWVFKLMAFLVLLAAIVLFALNRRALALLSFAAIIGAAYFNWYVAHHQQQFQAPFGVTQEFSVVVERVSSGDQSQQVTGRLQPPHAGRIRLSLRPYPIIAYGDEVSFSGILKKIEGPASGYFLKEGIGATISFPSKVAVVAHDRSSPIKARLFKIRDYVEQSFVRTLPPEAATLMTGLVLGKSGGFDKAFTEKLKATGTTHLVALSGYNISSIIKMLMLLLVLIINRRYADWLCILAVIGFVIMTGAEASVVRAAIMATIMVMAERSSRVYSVRNAVAVTAFVMVLVNPTILVFDVGFQLSFLALLGIVYIEPALRIVLRVSEEKSLLNWRGNLLTTTAAQLAVLPILLSSFGFFSPLAIVTNVLLLSFIPATMLCGALIILAGLFSSHLAFIVSLPARLLLNYELGIINLFSHVHFGVTVRGVSAALVGLYYAGLALLVLYAHKRNKLLGAI